MIYGHQQVIEQLGIDIELLLQNLTVGLFRQPLPQCDREIICRFLLGDRRKQIAETVHLSDAEVGNRLSSNIYPRIAELMQVDQAKIANNWVLILNFLLNPVNGYKLNPAPQLNSDNFQGSFGRQVFLYPANPELVQLQIKATQRYQQGLYYQALLLFIEAWSKEQTLYGSGNPEICIYINNCLIEYQRRFLEQRGIHIYTLAVVVPFHHNQGRIAAEILRGVAQIQAAVNVQNFNITELETEFCQSAASIFSIFSQGNPHRFDRMALQVMIVNDPNNVYAPYNQTAEKLANLADQINLVAVVGHYSSEMTQTALNFYTEKGIVLVNTSSTSDQLSYLDESIGFFRTTTHDSVSAARLIQYLSEDCGSQTIAIIYNKNSSYSCSYRTAVRESLKHYPSQFMLHSEYGDLGGAFQAIQTYLNSIQGNVDVIILIPDGGIEPNSLNNMGLISRLNLRKCVIAGSATFYQENVLHWMQERSQQGFAEIDRNQLIACIPWHWQSQQNGCQSDNTIAQWFCQIGSQLWGDENLTWRSATAFDAILIVLEALKRSADANNLIIQMRQLFKVKGKAMQGVTGTIQFHENGDRVAPPTEIVAVEPTEKASTVWKWSSLKSMS